MDDLVTKPNNTKAGFENTHWTIVLDAASQQTAEAHQALGQLCKTYWPPLYAFLRAQGRSRADAEDLTQGFLTYLLDKNGLRHVHPAKGKFRSFLLASLQNYAHNERDKQWAQKRGGGDTPFPIDASDIESAGQLADLQDPARLFERRWASTLISEVLRQLQERCVRAAKAELFEALHPFLTGENERGNYSAAASRLQMNEGAVRTAVSRLRNEYRELLRAEVGRTVETAAEVDDEIRYLFQICQRA